jgi:tetratricopeptide (TPR) repeat protein
MRTVVLIGALIVSVAGAAPAFADMKQDLADCPDPRRPTSADACTRVLASGRLPKTQRYIGYFNRGWAYRQAGDSARAQADFTTVLKLNPRYASGYYSRAVVAHDLREPDKAIADLKEALAIDNGFAAAHTLMGELLEARGDTAGARTHYQQALTATQKHIDARQAQAKARERLDALAGRDPTPALSTGSKKEKAAETPGTGKLDCRRFIPSAGTTISVDCEK